MSMVHSGKGAHLEKGVSKHFLSDPESTLTHGQDTFLEDIIFNFLRC